MPTPRLELIITRTADGATTATLHLHLAGRRAELAEDVPITIGDEGLRGLSSLPAAYGGALTNMIFVPALREAWQRALGSAEGSGEQLRVSLSLKGDDRLHALRWELLHDPLRGTPLAYREQVLLSRYLGSEHTGALRAATKPQLRAVIAVSAATGPGMASVDVAGEVERAVTGLGSIPATLIDGHEGRPRATLAALADALRGEVHILYLVCHGAIVQGQPMLYLERQPGEPALPIAGSDLVRQSADLARRPLLIVLASCRSAGDTYQVLATVGPQLARTGVGAVLGMQGDVPMELVATLIPRLFTELGRDGQIDRALAAARAALPADRPWWMPTLWMALNDGALWHTPDTAAVRGAGVFQVPYTVNPLFRGRDAELDQLAQALLSETSGTAAVLPALAGTGGIGKTQLASEFAHRYRDDFPGGVFWISMAQPESVAAQVAAAGGPGGLDLPGWSGLDFEGKIAAVRRAWNEPVRRLLVFDNLEDPQLLQEWRPTSGGARVLITTRRGVWTATSGVQAVRLATLARPESIRLLLTPRYGVQVETVLAEPAVAAEADAICMTVGDLPLALALAGAYLEQTPSLPLAGYRQRLAEALLVHPSLDAELEEGLPTRHATSVAATIALSYQQLDAAKSTDALALTLLQGMAYLAPIPIPQRLLVRLADRDPDDEGQAAEVDAPLRRLAVVGLVELLPESGVAMHRLTATFMR
ncbi:MAG: CHAT domain-containing protein, partial [Chloroflexales bacterium]|nr:CHAT domain-containing protein [Chloroflexales bacterium]